MTSVFKPLAISLAVASLFPAGAQAEPAAPVVITAARLPQLAKDVLADNVVISAEDIALSGAVTLVDLLQQQRGIEISRNGGPGTNSSVFVRGTSNAQNVVLVDGVRVGSATTGGATWAAIPLAQIERVEIVYGPLSALYGADAMGGVIQIFTKKGSREIVPVVSAGVGSYGLRKLDAGISGATGQFKFALNAGHEENEGFSASKPAAGAWTYNPDKDGYTQDSVSGRFSAEVAPGYELGTRFMQNRLNSQFDAGPGYDDRNILKLETIAVYGKGKLADNWDSSLQVAQSADLGTTDSKAYGFSQIDTRQNSLTWQNDVRLGGNTLLLIAERREEKVSTTKTAVNGTRDTNSLAASYVYKQDAHLLSTSLRYDRNSQFGSHSTGSIAYGYRVSNALRLNASYGTSFRAPTYNELYFPGYGISTNKPEQGKNAEIGAYYELGQTQFSAVYYSNKLTDLLVYAGVCPVQQDSHPWGCAYNVNHATLSGLTLGARTEIAGVSLRAALDIQDPQDDTTGLRLARRATQHGSLAAEYALGQTKFGAETVFSNRRYDDAGNKNSMGGYALLNLYVSHELAPNLNLLGRWNNALNKDYELARNYATIGSNLFVGVNYGFK